MAPNVQQPKGNKLPCLLKQIPDTVNQYSATPGTVSLVVVEGEGGTTNLDSVNCKLTDITNPSAPTSVDHIATAVSFTFQIPDGKRYLVQLAFIQIVNPYATTASLKEVCGQVLDTIDVTNLFPAYLVVSQ